MNRICRHAHKIQEMYRAAHPMNPEDVPPHIKNDDERMKYAGWSKVTDLDDNDPGNWQCAWRFDDLPPPILRSSGGNTLRKGDCDSCKFFEAVQVIIPGVKTTEQTI